jgi:hypothetical protein
VSTINATGSEEPAANRRRYPRIAALVWGTYYSTVSRRGLRHPVVMVRTCPYCSEPHQYRDTGLRIAACRRGYVVIRARRSRSSQ